MNEYGTRVSILLSIYNGADYLSELIESVLTQTYENVGIYIRDDGSIDSSQNILARYRDRVIVQKGDNIGYKKSFLKMLYETPDADIYMFCDQDDVWEKDKINTVVEMLKGIEKPAVYTSNVRYCTADLQSIGDSQFYDNENIWKALLYNQAVGCTMAFNHQLREKIMQVPLEKIDFSNIYSHDCWIYRICSAVGGRCVFDKEPHILYRQHDSNQIGGSATFLGTWKKRLKMIRCRHIKQKLALELENCYAEYINDDSTKEAIKLIAHYGNLGSKVKLLRQKEIYTDNKIDNIGLIVAILLNIV